ncbi:MAG: hypothetical protein GXO62_04460, partial [Epsilonproteobacteria bacterium]|nr:hypothetical protein [Campylobacterota bacterium]
ENEESEKLKVKNEKCEALEQIKEKRYYEKYMSEGKEIYLIGICFDKSKKNIAKFEWERL